MTRMYRPVGFRETRVPASVKARQKRTAINPTTLGLTPEQEQIFISNPHIQQVFVCQRTLQVRPLFTGEDRFTNDIETMPKSKYQRRTEEAKTVYHSGQRKLLLMEIEFLTKWSLSGDIVVYAGAAPGTHHDILTTMFPQLLFLLYDPASFPIQEIKNRREIHNEFFTDMTALRIVQRFQGKRILFVSDIRRFEEEIPDIEKESLIYEDMVAQAVWTKIIQPVAALLKFRPPYPDVGQQEISYFDGTIYFQPWTGATSSESRLLVLDPNRSKVYSSISYDDIMHHHNTVTRTTYYQQVSGVNIMPGCHCYDCASELYILAQYVAKYGGNVEQLHRQISNRFS